MASVYSSLLLPPLRPQQKPMFLLRKQSKPLKSNKVLLESSSLFFSFVKVLGLCSNCLLRFCLLFARHHLPFSKNGLVVDPLELLSLIRILRILQNFSDYLFCIIPIFSAYGLPVPYEMEGDVMKSVAPDFHRDNI